MHPVGRVRAHEQLFLGRNQLLQFFHLSVISEVGEGATCPQIGPHPRSTKFLEKILVQKKTKTRALTLCRIGLFNKSIANQSTHKPRLQDHHMQTAEWKRRHRRTCTYVREENYE